VAGVRVRGHGGGSFLVLGRAWLGAMRVRLPRGRVATRPYEMGDAVADLTRATERTAPTILNPSGVVNHATLLGK